MALTKSILREFDPDGESWESYSVQVEQYFARNHTPEDKKVSVLLAAVGPSVYKILKDSCHPDLIQLKSYPEISKLLEILFPQQALRFNKRIKFHEASQANNEDTYVWLVRVMNAAVSCEFGDQLHTMLWDKFLSGLSNKTMMTRLSEENVAVTLGHVADLVASIEQEVETHISHPSSEIAHPSVANRQEKEASVTNPRETEILDLPNEVLIRIFLNLDARDRVPLGHSCERFHSLVFEDKQLLRYLDFSKNGYLTSASDIQHYFSNEMSYKHILGVNVRGVRCIKPGPMLDTCIRNAVNLVDINIHDIVFEDVWHLGSFLNPLTNVKRLSFDWELDERNVLLCQKLLIKPFSRLSYLSVKVAPALIDKFVFSLQLCQELKKLCIEVGPIQCNNYPDIVNGQFRELRNLEIVQYSGPWVRKIKERIVSMLPEPEKWTDFQMQVLEARFDFYMEKNVEVCKELTGSEWMKLLPTAEWKHLNLGWALFPEVLLKAVLEITHKHVPEKLCCLSTFDTGHRCLMKVEEAKQLLKDPTFQISYLYLNHSIERSCDIHLIASAFPNLSELVLSEVVSSEDSTRNGPHMKRRLRKKSDKLSCEQNNLLNLDSSFKMLVENTPKLIHFSMKGSSDNVSGIRWDPGALYAISGWKSLKSLCLWDVLIDDGDLLIEIGRCCQHLQKLDVRDCHPTSCYKDGLLKMLRYCKNLRQLTLEADVGQISEVFKSLKGNKHLEKVTARTPGCEISAATFLSSLKQLLHCCSNLDFLSSEVAYRSVNDYIELKAAVERLKGELGRPNLQIRVMCVEQGSSTRQIGDICKDCPDFGPFPYMWTGN